MTEAEAWASARKYLVIVIYDSDGNISRTITNDDIKGDSMQLTQTLESGECLSFMGCNSAVFKVTLTDLSEDVRGCRMVATMSADAFTRILFDGVIEEQENLTHEDMLTEITAYDWMRQINLLDCTAWAKALTGITGFAPLWLMQKFWSEVIHVQLPDITMNSDLFGDWNSTKFTAEADFSQFDSITGETMMKWICQVGNVYGYMSGNCLAFKRLEPFAELLYPAVDLYPSTTLYPSDGSSEIQKIQKGQYISLDYEPYKVAQINSVAICDSAGVGQGYAPGTTAGSNCLYIDSNPLAWAMSMTALATDIYARVKDISFTPIELECVGMPYIGLGDVVRASTKKRTVHAYVLKRKLKGVQALRDEFDADCERYQSSHASSYSSLTSENGKTILKVQADQVEMKELIADRATIEELNAVGIKVGNLEADHVTTSSFNSLSGTVSTLSSKAITTDNLSAQSIDAGQITSGRISTDHLATSVITTNNLSAQSLNASKITTGSISLSNVQVDGQNASWAYIKVTGSSSTYWTYVLRHS